MLIISLALFLLPFFSMPVAYAAEVPSEIVKVKLSVDNATSVPFFIDGNYSLAEDTTVSLQRQLYTLKNEGSTLGLYFGETLLYSGTTATFLQHVPTEGRNNFIWLKNDQHGYRGYSGDLHFDISSSFIRVINHIYLEEYLYGVVPYEMSDTWPMEALKAQAIAARTYTAKALGAGDYNLGDTSAHQVYKGYDATKINAIAAVDATAKMVLTYNGDYVSTYYSASNGGYTEIPYHVWGGGEDMPFSIVADPYDVANPSSPYEEIFLPVAIDDSHPVTTSDNVEGTPNIQNAVRYIKQCILDSGKLSAAGYEAATIDDFDLTGVLQLVPHTLDADDNDPHTEDHSRIPPSGENHCVDYIMATGEFKVMANKLIDGKLVASKVSVDSIELDLRYFDGANGDDTYRVFNFSSLRLFVIEAKMEGETLLGYSTYHRRYGHGVGMSQRGAQQRADEGQLYSDILSFYYPGTSMEMLDINKAALTTLPEAQDNTNAKVICTTQLNVRSGPATSYAILGTVPSNARIEVNQSFATPDWHKINYGTQDAYLHKDYVQLDTVTAVTGISLNQSTLTLNTGESQTLVATLTPDNASNQNVTWTTNNEAVATVTSAGEVRGVSAGTATIMATSVDGGFVACCEVAVNETQITSSVYSIDRDNQRLLGVADGTTVAALKANLDNTGDAIGVYNADGTAYTGEFVGTGTVVKLIINNTVMDELEVCVLGDVSGDGVIDIMDYTYVRLDIFDLRDLVGVCARAGDVSGDGMIDIMDYTYIRLDIFNLRPIS